MANDNETEYTGIMYDSAYLAEFYDCFWAKFFDYASDTHTYLDIFKKACAARKNKDGGSEPMVFLDVGTGTGRILKHVGVAACRDGLDLSNVKFIGLDISQSMLDRASLMACVGDVSWVLGSALSLESALSVPSQQPTLARTQGRPQVDCLVFAFGSIAHLDQPGQTQKFFNQVSSVLRPGSGLAAISVGDYAVEAYTSNSIPLPPEMTDLTSRQFPGVVYQYKTVGEDIVDSCREDRLRVTVARVGRAMRREILEEGIVGVKHRLFSQSELMEEIKAAGLRVVEVHKGEGEFVYILQVPASQNPRLERI